MLLVGYNILCLYKHHNLGDNFYAAETQNKDNACLYQRSFHNWAGRRDAEGMQNKDSAGLDRRRFYNWPGTFCGREPFLSIIYL